MKYCLRGLLGIKQREAVFSFLDLCRKMLAEKQNITEIPVLLSEANEVFVKLEKYMPITIQVSIFTAAATYVYIIMSVMHTYLCSYVHMYIRL